MSKEKKIIKEAKRSLTIPFKDYWDKNNYILIATSLIVLTLGYFFMSQGNWDSFFSLIISPIILLFAYTVIIPFAILLKPSVKNNNKTNVSSKD